MHVRRFLFDCELLSAVQRTIARGMGCVLFTPSPKLFFLTLACDRCVFSPFFSTFIATFRRFYENLLSPWIPLCFSNGPSANTEHTQLQLKSSDHLAPDLLRTPNLDTSACQLLTLLVLLLIHAPSANEYVECRIGQMGPRDCHALGCSYASPGRCFLGFDWQSIIVGYLFWTLVVLCCFILSNLTLFIIRMFKAHRAVVDGAPTDYPAPAAQGFPQSTYPQELIRQLGYSSSLQVTSPAPVIVSSAFDNTSPTALNNNNTTKLELAVPEHADEGEKTQLTPVKHVSSVQVWLN